jgi:hypothetical protein
MSRSFNHRRHRNDEDVLKDGERRRIPMMAMDSLQRAVAQGNLSDAEQRAIELTKQKLAADASQSVTDGHGNTGIHLRRPGARFAPVDTAALDAVTTARREYLTDISTAYLSPVEDEAGTQEGARANRRKRSQYRDPEGREAGTEEETEDAQQTRARVTGQAYADYDQELRDAYKRG